MGIYADPQGICACLIPHIGQPFSSCLELPMRACVNSQDPAPPGFPPVSTGGRMGVIATKSIAFQPKYSCVGPFVTKKKSCIIIFWLLQSQMCYLVLNLTGLQIFFIFLWCFQPNYPPFCNQLYLLLYGETKYHFTYIIDYIISCGSSLQIQACSQILEWALFPNRLFKLAILSNSS